MEPEWVEGWHVIETLGAEGERPGQKQGRNELTNASIDRAVEPEPAPASVTNGSGVEPTTQRKNARVVRVLAYETKGVEDEGAKSTDAVQAATLPDEGLGNREEETSAIDRSSAPATEDVIALRKELCGAYIMVDYLLLGIFLLGVCYLGDGMVLASTTGAGFGLAISALWWLGSLTWRDAIILLINVVVLVPFNIANFVIYWMSYPLRLLLYQAIQFVLIPLFSWGKSFKSFQDATFAELLRVMPHLFSFFMTGLDPKYRTFGDNIDDATSDQARDAMIHAPLFQLLHEVMEIVPKCLLSSVVVRLIIQMFLVPTLGWWWAGWCYIPLLPLRSQQQGDDQDALSPLPPVQIKFTKCKWLKVARESFGEDVGKAKCVNE